ncbi:FG-GAP-like repeat-containing protein [Paludisphaera soli]|uniref:FG-GAP-like repeat-containing protein n=1 Tax=Paludisphaera soli TaxID=2712865 RepID=UPI0013EC53A5|nr:FG-GAP-like repeat-containing protein [Paludisphaera soli]
MAAKRKPARRRVWRVALVLVVLAAVAVGAAFWLAASARDSRPADSMAAIRAAASQGRWAEVDGRLARWIEAHPGDGEARLMRGMLLAGIGKSADAAELLRGVPDSAPERVRAMTTVGEIALRLHDAPEAERAFRQAAADPKEAEPRRRLIYLLSLQQRHGEARDVLWELFRATRDPRVLSSLVQNLSAYENDARGFTAEVDEFLARTPTDPFLRRIKGLALAMQGRPAEALPHLEAAAEALADDPVGRFALAECLLTLGRFRGDESILGPRPEAPADAARWSVLRGRLQEALDRPDDALASFREAATANPRDPEAHYRLGQALNRLGRADEARRSLDRAAAIKAEQVEFRRAFDAALRKGFDVDPPYETLGALCRGAGLTAEARAWYELAAGVDPSSASARSALGELPEAPTPPPVALSRPVRAKAASDVGRLAASAAQTASPVVRLQLEDVTASAGISYQYDCAAKGDLYLGDTMGGGVGLIDYDDDGRLDIYFVNGCRLPYDPADPPGPNKLYRNRGDGTFEDVTEKAGAPGQGYGMGCVVGDYDGDGRDDLFVTGLGRTVLYRNKGDGTFEDVTEKAGVGSDRWTTAAGFGDFDGDGDLDLFVVTYVSADPVNVPECRDGTGRALHCSPALFEAQPDLLFRNDGDGTFTDVSRESGVDAAPGGRGLGMAVADLDGDGRLDVFVANDLSPDFLFLNRGGLRFEESALEAGVALNGAGRATASMGVVADDLDGDGLTDLFVANFLNEPDSLFRNLGKGLFVDATLGANLHASGPIATGFGVAAPDFDDDGRPDLFMANGHVDDQPWINTPMAQLPQAFHGGEGGRFEPIDPSTVPYLSRRVVARGLAAGDLDGDGRVDLVVVHRDAPAVVLKNTTPGGRSVGLRLRGRSGSTPVGARVACRVGGKEQVRILSSGTGYLSAHDPRLWFGLGGAERAESIRVRWPSGLEQEFADLPAGGVFELREGEPEARRRD